jgi:hypothetical protein
LMEYSHLFETLLKDFGFRPSPNLSGLNAI